MQYYPNLKIIVNANFNQGNIREVVETFVDNRDIEIKIKLCPQ